MTYAELYLKSRDNLLGVNDDPQEDSDTELYHHGVLGQRKGVRRYQNLDGSLTALGRIHYGYGKVSNKAKSIAENHKKAKQEKAAKAEKERVAKQRREKAAVRKAEKERAAREEQEKAEAEKKAAEQRKLDEETKEQIRNKAVNSGDPDFVLKYNKYLTNDDMEKAISRINMNAKVLDASQRNKQRLGEKFDNAMKWVDRGVKVYNLYADVTATLDVKRRNEARNKLARLDPNDENNADMIKRLTTDMNTSNALPRFTNASDYLNRILNKNSNNNNQPKQQDNNQQNDNQQKPKQENNQPKQQEQSKPQNDNQPKQESKPQQNDDQPKSRKQRKAEARAAREEQQKQEKQSSEMEKLQKAWAARSSDAHMDKVRREKEFNNSLTYLKESISNDYDPEYTTQATGWFISNGTLNGKSMVSAKASLKELSKAITVGSGSDSHTFHDYNEAGAFYLDKFGNVSIDKRKLKNAG